MSRPLALASCRLAFGLLVLVAIGVQLRIHAQLGFSLVNFFSYFTNLSNLLAGFVLLLVAVRAFAGAPYVRSVQWLRAAAAVNMTVVGIVFALLLREVDLGALQPWVNTVLHEVMPVAVLLDWLVQPPRPALEWRRCAWLLVFPAAYLGYTLVRGALVGWYPYPFLNPANVGGYQGVAVYALGIALTFAFVTAALWALAAWRVASRGVNRP